MNKNEEHFPVTNKLNTDVLQAKYGKITADVLRHDNVKEIERWQERIREARLIDKDNILRVYALTFLTFDKNNQEIATIDEEIRLWWLIWVTFREHWYIVKKNVLDVFMMDIPDWIENDFMTTWGKAKARISEFYAKSESTHPLIYGIVLEVYSPDFRYRINKTDKDQINPSTWTLQDSGIPVDEIRERLDRATDKHRWDDWADRYKQAKKLSKKVVKSLHKKINKYIHNKSESLLLKTQENHH